MELKNNHVNNLESDDAIQKLKGLVESAEVCMFETILPQPPFNVRPMSPVKVSDEGAVWFFSSRNSKKNREIAAHPNVQLLFSNSKKNEFLSIYGSAEIVTDKKKMQEVWSPIVKAWFPDGVQDPDLSLIKVMPESSYYWDTKHNKMTALIKTVISVLPGNIIYDGVGGTLKV